MIRSAAPSRAGQARNGHGWQLILADLALILFLLTLSALPAAEAETGQRLAARAVQEQASRKAVRPEIAAAQSLYRPVAGGPSLGAWLKDQAPDPRATLTIFAIHRPGAEPDAWARAGALAAEARASGARVRTIISAGAEDEIYASLAYDEQIASGGAAKDAS
jgi:hypothetical protein